MDRGVLNYSMPILILLGSELIRTSLYLLALNTTWPNRQGLESNLNYSLSSFLEL